MTRARPLVAALALGAAIVALWAIALPAGLDVAERLLRVTW